MQNAVRRIELWIAIRNIKSSSAQNTSTTATTKTTMTTRWLYVWYMLHPNERRVSVSLLHTPLKLFMPQYIKCPTRLSVCVSVLGVHGVSFVLNTNTQTHALVGWNVSRVCVCAHLCAGECMSTSMSVCVCELVWHRFLWLFEYSAKAISTNSVPGSVLFYAIKTCWRDESRHNVCSCHVSWCLEWHR